jgi:thiol:disulfide interchange protein DsbD
MGLKSKRLGAFLTGVLAVVVAAPCTAPFMASAVGIGLSQGGLVSLVIFLALGVGFAFPIVALTVLITSNPALMKYLPRPGKWMDALKIALAIPMILSALWLWWVFSRQLEYPAPLVLAIAMGGFALSLVTKQKVIKGVGVTLALVLGMFATTFDQVAKQDVLPDISTPNIVFSVSQIEALRAQNKAVFVDLTASWCVTCKVNEKLVLDTPQFAALMKDNDVTFMVGDWTNADPEITAYLESFDRQGVPLYVYYPKNNKPPIILPQMLDRAKISAMVMSDTP